MYAIGILFKKFDNFILSFVYEKKNTLNFLFLFYLLIFYFRRIYFIEVVCQFICIMGNTV